MRMTADACMGLLAQATKRAAKVVAIQCVFLILMLCVSWQALASSVGMGHWGWAPMQSPKDALAENLKDSALLTVTCDAEGGDDCNSDQSQPIHLFVDASDCPFDKVDSLASLSKLLQNVAKHAGDIQQASVHKEFVPQGVTILTLQRTGHSSVHTWPEENAALFDLVVQPTKTLSVASIFAEEVRSLLGCKTVIIDEQNRRLEMGSPPEVQNRVNLTQVLRSAPLHRELAKHLIVDLAGCPEATLQDSALLYTVVGEAGRIANLTEVGTITRNFPAATDRQSLKSSFQRSMHAAVLMEESHIALHTLPDSGVASLDVMTCAPLSDAQALAIEEAVQQRLSCINVGTALRVRGI